MTDMTDANFPMDGEGRTYHLYLKRGEAANRIVTVGDVPRAFLIAKTPGFEVKFVREAPRLFITITGLYKGVPVSLVTSLMGIPNMDFMVRELKAIVPGPMAIIRVGTCGSPLHGIGEVTIPEEYHTVLRIPDALTDRGATLSQKYLVSHKFEPDMKLVQLLRDNCRLHCSVPKTGQHISTCSFYSTQGRIDPKFDDQNGELMDHLVALFPELASIEMETAHMLDLASHCSDKIHACGAHIILAQRRSQDFLGNSEKHKIEAKIGHAALETITNFQFDAQMVDGVWNHEGGVLGDWEKLKDRF